MQLQKVNYQSKPIKTAVYNDFKGVDLSNDPMLINRNRMAYALNLISDYGGMPEKRVGYRTLQSLGAAINGLYYCVIGDVAHYLVHAGANLYKVNMADNTRTLLMASVSNSRSTGFFYGGKLYILTGGEYLVYDGTVQRVSDIAYIPTVAMNRKPNGGGGTMIDGFNLICRKWTEEFVGDGSSKDYQLSFGNLDSTLVAVKMLNADGSYTTKTEGTDFSVNRILGRISFNTAPPSTPVEDRSNVVITASRLRQDYLDRINKAKTCTVFEDTVVFMAGSVKGVDFCSGINGNGQYDPTYFSDLGYDNIGTNETDIMGYLKLGEQLCIIKAENAQDATIYLRTKKILDNGTVRYVKSQGAVGVGAISRYAMGNLRDDVLFLSRQGVFAVASNRITFERSLQNRSYYIDSMLTKEPNLNEAVAVEWDGYFIVSVNGRCYVLDGKQNKSYKTQAGGDFVYECYLWDNIAATCFREVDGALYFGTADGKLCRFNTDIEGMTRYNDDGAAIVAIMRTKFDDDGAPQMLKTLQKRGSCVTVKPYTRSSAKIAVRTEQDTIPREIAFEYKDIFSWEDIDFNRFTFNSNDAAQDIYLNTKVKHYKRLQFTVVNDAINEGFGIFQIVKNYTVDKLAKR